MNDGLRYNYPDKEGRFGEFGGKYVPETLITALDDLEKSFFDLKDDNSFLSEINELQKSFNGRPTPLYFAERLTEYYGKARIYLKREDLCHTGAHKINNTIGQIVLAKRLGKKRIIAETGAGQHGVATACVCSKFGLECIVYMGAIDVERQKLNVFRMELMGAKVIPVKAGSKTLKDATSAAIRDWVANINNTHYIIGSVVGPHPYPMLVRDFQSIIGEETKKQIIEQTGKLPDSIIACVGGGSNSIGIFYPFVEDQSVELIGVEAAGEGLNTDKNSATLTLGETGIFHGMKTKLLQDEFGQIHETHSISAGLDYPGVGPEHAFLLDEKRVRYESVDDNEAIEALKRLSTYEGILPALETAHALAYLENKMSETSKDDIVVVNISGRGDKDLNTIFKLMNNKND